MERSVVPSVGSGATKLARAARALDPSKLLLIYRTDEDKDIVNETSVLPRMPMIINTGMEKG